mmetsp:Transcript_85897/g.179540  ORF Transcript_85897/g.179540 Transcript_85897/m.179540 type:complete len:294 (-) Transcript_85897:1290-2171(-)
MAGEGGCERRPCCLRPQGSQGRGGAKGGVPQSHWQGPDEAANRSRPADEVHPTVPLERDLPDQDVPTGNSSQKKGGRSSRHCFSCKTTQGSRSIRARKEKNCPGQETEGAGSLVQGTQAFAGGRSLRTSTPPAAATTAAGPAGNSPRPGSSLSRDGHSHRCPSPSSAPAFELQHQGTLRTDPRRGAGAEATAIDGEEGERRGSEESTPGGRSLGSHRQAAEEVGTGVLGGPEPQAGAAQQRKAEAGLEGPHQRELLCETQEFGLSIWGRGYSTSTPSTRTQEDDCWRHGSCSS